MLSLSATRTGARSLRVVAAVVALQLGAGLVSVALVRDTAAPAPAAVAPRARALPQAPLPSTPPDGEARREAAVERLLGARAAAVLGRDRDAFLATVDPRARALRTRQARLFDALAQVPLGSWSYQLDARTESPPDSVLDKRYGPGQWWAPAVTFGYTLAGFDERRIRAQHHLTFVRSGGRWLLGADDDFASVGKATPRALWDRGPVVAVRAKGVLVLGHPGSPRLLRNVAALTADAIPRVTAVWGRWARRAVVLVPADEKELSGLLGSEGDLSQIAAVATAELRGDADDYDPAGDRVLVNPATFPRLGQLGRRVVLTHEVTHVATRRASGPGVPAWLAEGLADYVGYRGVDVPLAVAARDLRRDVRAGRVPRALPADADFDGGNKRLAQAYEGSWLAVRLLADRYGQDALLRLYRTVGASRGEAAERALDDALRTQLRTTRSRFTADWRASLRRQLG